MRIVKPMASLYLAVMAGWVLVHFSEHTFFDDHPEDSLSEASDRFALLDVFMASAFLVAAITSFLDMRSGAKKSPPPSSW